MDLHIGTPGTSFQVPPPPQWYGLLPDMTYTWRVRTAAAPASLGLDDPGWTPWAQQQFRTPAVASDSISLQGPGSVVSTLTPTLRWANARSDVFYYDLELSRDPGFNQDPGAAIAPVYSAVIHGGLTSPQNSYTVPAGQPLEGGATYYWRVRPHIQGDGRQLPWAPAARFATAPAVSDLEGQTLGLINGIRAQHGLGVLGVAPELSLAAKLHSEDMAAMNVMTHTGSDGSDPGDRETRAGYTWRMYGEIVAAGYRTPEAVVNGWMNSPSHREVILLPDLAEFGCGVAYSASGRPYWTVDFGRRR